MDANIGLPTGRNYNSLIILDLDISSEIDGIATLSQLLDEYHIILPDTAISQTGSGGRHLYYRDSGLTRIESRKNAFPGIDILSEGAHVVAPPSVHENGKKYQWIHSGPTYIEQGNDALYRLILSQRD